MLASLLPQAPAVPQQAKDVSRAACLPLLAVDDGEVAKDVKIAEELAGAARAPRRAAVCRSRTEAPIGSTGRPGPGGYHVLPAALRRSKTRPRL